LARGFDRYARALSYGTDDAKNVGEFTYFLFSSEPVKFTEVHIGEFREKGKLSRKIMRMINGEVVPWYGSRMIQSLNYLRQAATEAK
jgi:hypothetical protein